MKKLKERFLNRIAIIIFFVFTICLYGPYSIYLANAEEFWFSLPMFSSAVIPVTLIALVFLVALSLILPETKGRILFKLFFGLTLAMYFQGNFMNISYGTGVLDGTEIVWSDYIGYAIINTVLWIVLLSIPFIIDIIVKKDKKKFYMIVSCAAIFFTVIQIPAFISQALSYKPIEKNDFIISKDEMFEISDKDNVFIFVLDTMDEAYYQAFIENHPEYTENMEGFVHYSNAAAAGARTIVAMPAMFTGKPFTRSELYSQYLQDVWSKSNVFSVMKAAGYKVNVYSETTFFSSDTVEYINNFHNTRGSIESMPAFTKSIYKMDLYKFMPHLLKRFFWYNTTDFEESRATADNPYKMNDAVFYKEFAKKGFVLDSSAKKTIQLYHLSGAHSPYTLDETGKKVSKSTLTKQVEGNFYQLSFILQDLKDKGLYENATIIILADHGDLNQAQYAMLLIKRAGEMDEYTTSSAPVSFFDLAPFLASIAGKELDNDYCEDLTALAEDEERERHFFYNTSGNSHLIINEYVTTGFAGNKSNWKLLREYEDTVSGSEKYTLGTLLYFTTEATGNIYTTEGFGNNTGFRTKMFGPVSSLVIPIAELPASGNIKATITFHAPPDFPFVIVANGVQVFESEKDVSALEKIVEVDIPVDSFGADKVLSLDIKFPVLDESEMKVNVKKRTFTAGLKYLILAGE